MFIPLFQETKSRKRRKAILETEDEDMVPVKRKYFLRSSVRYVLNILLSEMKALNSEMIK